MVIIIFLSFVVSNFFSKNPNSTNIATTNIVANNFVEKEKREGGVDYLYFRTYLKSIYSNNCPTLDISRGASIPTQLSFIEVLSQLELQEENKLNNIMDSVFMYLPAQKYNAYNIDVLQKFQTKNNTVVLNEINNSNINQLNLFNNGEQGVVEDFHNIKTWAEHIKNITGAQKLDFMIEEITFHHILEDAIETPENSVLEYLIKNCNQIIIATDGAWHTKNFVPYLIELLKGNQEDKEVTITNLRGILNNTHHLSTKDIKDILQIKDFNIRGKRYPDFIHFIHYDASFIANLDYLYNISSYDINFTNYQDIFNTPTAGNEFCSLYANLFLGNSSLSNIFVNNLEAYDPHKKNLIFIGSSLFSPYENSESRLSQMPHILQYVQNSIDFILQDFDLSQYNIIWKLHPIYNNEWTINYVKLITNNKIPKPIIVNPKIPFEVLLTNDYYQYQNHTGNNFIFKGSNDNEVMQHSTLFGLQATTTTIHVTRKFLQSTFNLDKYQVANLVSFANFPIPDGFPIVKKLDADNENTSYYNDNLKEINEIYKWYCISILKDAPSLANEDFFMLNHLRHLPFLPPSINLPLVIGLSVGGCVVIAIGITTTIIIVKKKQGKLVK